MTSNCMKYLECVLEFIVEIKKFLLVFKKIHDFPIFCNAGK